MISLLIEILISNVCFYVLIIICKKLKILISNSTCRY